MSKSTINGKSVLWVSGLLLVLLATFWAVLALKDGAERRAVLQRLPAEPDMSLHSAKLRELVDRAEARVLDDQLGPAVGALGNLYLANLYYDEAATCYELAREIDPANPRWPYQLGYVKSMMGDSANAMLLLDNSLRLAPEYVPAWLRRADNLYKSGQLDDAESDYKQCVSLDPTNAYAHLGLARVAIAREDWDAAEDRLLNAIQADPSFGAAHRLLATVHERFGRMEERDRELQIAEACGRFFPAPDPWLDDIEELCFHTGKLLARGYLAEKVDKLDLAQSVYERVIDIDPDNFDASFRLATVLQAQGERNKAEALFETALKLGSQDETRYPVILNNLGEIHYRNGEIGKAIERFRSALELDPEFESAHLSLGAVLTQQGHPDEAILHCQKGLALNPNSDAAHFNWGLALLKLGKPDEAVIHFEQAVRLNPDLSAAYYQIGVYHLQAGNREAGGQYLRRALDAAEKTGNRALAAQIRKLIG